MNDEKMRTSSYRTRSHVGDFFSQGETENEMICQICPGRKVIRKHLSSTSNLHKHLKRVHPNEFRRAMERQEVVKMKLVKIGLN